VNEESPLFVGFYAAAAIKGNVIDYIKALRQHIPNLKILWLPGATPSVALTVLPIKFDRANTAAGQLAMF